MRPPVLQPRLERHDGSHARAIDEDRLRSEREIAALRERDGVHEPVEVDLLERAADPALVQPRTSRTVHEEALVGKHAEHVVALAGDHSALREHTVEELDAFARQQRVTVAKRGDVGDGSSSGRDVRTESVGHEGAIIPF
jgi:hypothetical protein